MRTEGSRRMADLGTSQVQVVPIRCFAVVFACSCRLLGVPERAEFGYLHSNVKTDSVVHVPHPWMLLCMGCP